MADLVTGSDILLHVGLAALAGRSEFRLRRGHRNRKHKYRKAAKNLIFHVFPPWYGGFGMHGIYSESRAKSIPHWQMDLLGSGAGKSEYQHPFLGW